MRRRIDLAVVRLVALKELRESLRDRRTLFVALILPVLIYPLVLLGFGPLVGRQRAQLATQEQPVAVTGPGAASLVRLVLSPSVVQGSAPALRVVTTATPAEDLASRRVALWIDVPGDFDASLAGDGTASVRVRFDGSDEQSREAKDKWDRAYDAATDRILAGRLEARGLKPSWRKPLGQEVHDVAPADRSAAFFYGKVLALLLVLMTLTSSFYPAVDAVAGEKERGTMETLLVAPCGRTELVLGKFIAVCCVTLAAALLNLASLAFSTGPGLSALGSGKIPALAITWQVVLGILAVLVPLAALFSAIAVSLSTLARSIKEAQHYLSPLVMLVMPLAMAVTLPNLPLTPTLAAVPVTNAVLFFRDLMLGRTEWGTTLIVLGSTFGFAALGIWSSVLLFLREETLFRGPESKRGLISRPAPQETPSASAAVFLFAGALAIMVYLQPALQRVNAANILVTQVAIVLAPCLLFALWLRVRPSATFRIGITAPAWISIAFAVVMGLAVPSVISAASQLLPEPPKDGMFKEIDRQLGELVHATPSLQIALLLGVLPALCEELFFRGFVLSGFRSGFSGRGATARAILASAACFALFHILPERWPSTFALGCLLGWLTVRTGSIWPGVVVHALNNASVVLAEKHGDAFPLIALYDKDNPAHRPAVAAAAGALVAALVFTWALTRRKLVRPEGIAMPRGSEA